MTHTDSWELSEELTMPQDTVRRFMVIARDLLRQQKGRS